MQVTLFMLLEVLALTALSTFIIIEFVTPLAVKLGLVDRPNNTRKHHVGDVPLAGGIAVFISTAIGCAFWLGEAIESLKFYFLASSLVVFVGILDDKYELSVRARLVGQIIVSFMIVIGAQTHLTALGDLFGLGNIVLSPSVAFFLTVFAVLAVINAFNMLDGMDGLLGSVSIVPLMASGFLMLNYGMHLQAFVAFTLSSAIVPFLVYNIGIPGNKLTKIFLGDAGSMFLGLSVAFLMIAGSQGKEIAFSPVTALWLTAIPLMDLATVTARRLYKKNPIFNADKEHLHHVLLRAGFSRAQILLMVMAVSLLFAVIGILGELAGLPEPLMFAAFLICFATYAIVIHGRIRQRKFLVSIANFLNRKRQAEFG
ncbi:undecaprenyl-phosphate alpha-N-acetylglucosaminyl 1-phosphate transferase [Neiella marina]|uniref:Undecaprenyl-phosphate alpha-N-acetylglucosaminyl 1-phosphate transferase n=1 Tax=Neiella holothuriorum TaxID=2870530 RepID=A0ABS7EEK8_9GAMM|nr:undecaprenyl-phosphate alpha-N-acetylglucosaminyl 1-phosphate transferase [Neiella holothuriorum]MBW8190765.1 undecaprenyl-phosphate alpha-N-acetylglucosaminyl 1-phosphate transferase [Neiella holothuriorum]